MSCQFLSVFTITKGCCYAGSFVGNMKPVSISSLSLLSSCCQSSVAVEVLPSVGVICLSFVSCYMWQVGFDHLKDLLMSIPEGFQYKSIANKMKIKLQSCWFIHPVCEGHLLVSDVLTTWTWAAVIFTQESSETLLSVDGVTLKFMYSIWSFETDKW